MIVERHNLVEVRRDASQVEAARVQRPDDALGGRSEVRSGQRPGQGRAGVRLSYGGSCASVTSDMSVNHIRNRKVSGFDTSGRPARPTIGQSTVTPDSADVSAGLVMPGMGYFSPMFFDWVQTAGLYRTRLRTVKAIRQQQCSVDVYRSVKQNNITAQSHLFKFLCG